jgi:hypothetical protein
MNRTSTSKKGQKTLAIDDGDVSKNLFADNSKKKPIARKTTARKGNADYQNFYKFHFSHLKQDHPNWNNKQITAITTLLWKRYKTSANKKTVA